MNRVDRLLGIILTLQSRKFVQAETLARKYELSVRTIYRDIKALNEIGVPVYFEPQKGYGILDEHFLPPLLFTVEEANSLLMLQALATKFADKSIISNSGTALEKIKSVLKNHDWQKFENLSSKTAVYIPDGTDNNKDYLTRIQSAIVDKHILSIDYTDNNDNKTHRKIEPVGLIFYSEQWHLIAWCQLRAAYRDFKVNRIDQLFATSEAFTKEHSYTIQEYMKIF